MQYCIHLKIGKTLLTNLVEKQRAQKPERAMQKQHLQGILWRRQHQEGLVGWGAQDAGDGQGTGWACGRVTGLPRTRGLWEGFSGAKGTSERTHLPETSETKPELPSSGRHYAA